MVVGLFGCLVLDVWISGLVCLALEAWIFRCLVVLCFPLICLKMFFEFESFWRAARAPQGTPRVQTIRVTCRRGLSDLIFPPLEFSTSLPLGLVMVIVLGAAAGQV